MMMRFGLASSGVKNVPKLSAIQKVDGESTKMSGLECSGELLEMKVQLDACVV
jgi:hypothetical protein